METQKTFFQNGAVWSVQTKAWSAAEKLHAKDVDKSEDEIPEIFKLGKKSLVPEQWKTDLTGFRARASLFMAKMGVRFIAQGLWFVNARDFQATEDGLRKIKDDMVENVNRFLGEYENIKREMIDTYGEAVEGVEWPTHDKILKSFDMRWMVFQVGETQVSEIDPEDIKAIKEKFKADLERGYDNLKDAILDEAHSAIIEACNDISSRILDNQEKVTEKTLKRPRRVIDEYMKAAELFDLPTVKAKIVELRALTGQYTAKQIRGDEAVKTDFAEAMKALGKDIGDLVDKGRVKRRVKVD